MACLETVKADDCVECYFFVLDDSASGPEALEELRLRIEVLVGELSEGYIWHKDGLRLHKRFSSGGVSLGDDDLPSHVYGVCQFGDNVDDEWFVVYLARRVTSQFHNVAVKIVDADGEFLLIEAANSLPSWAEPSTTSNRVYFHKGSLLLIPPSDNEGDERITVAEALQQIIGDGDKCLASNQIVEDVLLRIEGYPEKIKESFHTVTAYVPVGAAALLKEDPSLVSAAAHAFCNRDPVDMKACRAMRHFPPENRVNASVKFTRCLYAMLVHNQFHPDRRTGWNLPLANAPQHKAHSLGVKLACGFEILVSQAKPPDSFESTKSWDNYLANLKKRGYFRDLLEGSKEYEGLLANAKDYYKDNLHSMKTTPETGARILSLLGSVDTDVQLFRKNEPLLPKDDDESWLYIDPKELETMLEKRYGKKNFLSLNGQADSSQFSGKMNEFLEHMSGADGAEFPNQSAAPAEDDSDMPVRPKRGIKTKKLRKQHSEKDESRSPSLTRKYKVDFDPDQFSSAIQNILDLVIPEDKWNSDSESDLEYGSEDDIGGDIFELPQKENILNSATMKKYMEEMDRELAATSIGKSFGTKTDGTVDIDKNALVNIKKSYMGEGGGTGPAGNILGPLGYAKMEDHDSIDEEVD